MLPLMKLDNPGFVTKNWRIFEVLYMVCDEYVADRLIIWEGYFGKIKIQRYKRRAEMKLAKSFSWKYWERLA